MKYYIIKTHYIPTEKNTRSDVCEHDYYIGKSNFNMDTQTTFDMKNNEPWICDFTIKHAYTRLCDAKRSLKKHQAMNDKETNDGYWIVNSEIMEIEY